MIQETIEEIISLMSSDTIAGVVDILAIYMVNISVDWNIPEEVSDKKFDFYKIAINAKSFLSEKTYKKLLISLCNLKDFIQAKTIRRWKIIKTSV